MSWKLTDPRVRRLLAICAFAIAAVVAAPESGWAGGGGDGGGKDEGDHWSIFSLVVTEAAMHNIQGMLGQTWIAGDPQPSRVMHIPAYIFMALVVMLCGFLAGKHFRNTEAAVRPSGRFGLASVIEVLLESIYNLAASMMDEKWVRKAFPLLATLALIIFMSNVLGSFPGFFPPTDNLNTTLAMALVVFFATHWFGFQASGPAYLKHFFGPMAALAPLIFVIELIGHIARPMSLSIRLMGNMTADHKVLAIFLGFGLWLVPLPIQVLGMIVALVQTVVFVLLSTVYIALAVEHDDH